MVRMELNEEESEVLRLVLEDYLSELRMEIAHTDSMDFREALKEREELLKRLIAQLAGG